MRNDWRWSKQALIEYLATRNAMAAMAGRPCPVAARVLARLEGGN
jgi:hypothetical protein